MDGMNIVESIEGRMVYCCKMSEKSEPQRDQESHLILPIRLW